MATKQIRFNTTEVQATLEDRKTVTRRAVKPYIIDRFVFGSCGKPLGSFTEEVGDVYPTVDDAPYQFGDIMWVRETWFKHTFDVDPWQRFHYKADDYEIAGNESGWQPPWRPSIHMPKEAARLFLRVTDVRVERLQEITEDGIKQEGIQPRFKVRDKFSKDIARQRYSELWDSTIKKSDLDRYGWAANPWVFVYAFERCERPEGFVQ